MNVNSLSTNDEAIRRQYSKVSNEKREELLILIVDQKMTITEAAEKTGIKYENAKAIYRIFREEGRTGRKMPDERAPRGGHIPNDQQQMTFNNAKMKHLN